MRPRITLLVIAAAACTAASAAVGYANPASTQRFTLTAKTVQSKDSPIHVIAAGPISGVGTVQLKSSQNSRIDHMTLRLAQGEVFLVATEASYAVHPDLPKCIATSVGQGTFTITGGTNAFHGARGHGIYRRHGILIGARSPSGTCLGRKAPPKASSITVAMTGTAELGSTRASA